MLRLGRLGCLGCLGRVAQLFGPRPHFVAKRPPRSTLCSAVATAAAATAAAAAAATATALALPRRLWANHRCGQRSGSRLKHLAALFVARAWPRCFRLSCGAPGGHRGRAIGSCLCASPLCATGRPLRSFTPMVTHSATRRFIRSFTRGVTAERSKLPAQSPAARLERSESRCSRRQNAGQEMRSHRVAVAERGSHCDAQGPDEGVAVWRCGRQAGGRRGAVAGIAVPPR